MAEITQTQWIIGIAIVVLALGLAWHFTTRASLGAPSMTKNPHSDLCSPNGSRCKYKGKELGWCDYGTCRPQNWNPCPEGSRCTYKSNYPVPHQKPGTCHNEKCQQDCNIYNKCVRTGFCYYCKGPKQCIFGKAGKCDNGCCYPIKCVGPKCSKEGESCKTRDGKDGECLSGLCCSLD